MSKKLAVNQKTIVSIFDNLCKPSVAQSLASIQKALIDGSFKSVEVETNEQATQIRLKLVFENDEVVYSEWADLISPIIQEQIDSINQQLSTMNNTMDNVLIPKMNNIANNINTLNQQVVEYGLDDILRESFSLIIAARDPTYNTYYNKLEFSLTKRQADKLKALSFYEYTVPYRTINTFNELYSFLKIILPLYENLTDCFEYNFEVDTFMDSFRNNCIISKQIGEIFFYNRSGSWSSEPYQRTNIEIKLKNQKTSNGEQAQSITITTPIVSTESDYIALCNSNIRDYKPNDITYFEIILQNASV